ncbi:C13 family peptidase [Nanoarchaeota archaeon]
MGIKKTLTSIIASLILTVTGCQGISNLPLEVETKESGKKYAVLCTGASTRNKEEGLSDIIDKNTFWIATVNAYNELIKNGHKPENIFVLYKDGKPPFDDPDLLNKISKIKKEFDGSYTNISTKKNLINLLNSLESTIMPEDNFTLYINQHGSASGAAYFEFDDSYIFGKELGRVLKGNKSKNILIILGTCHAESFALQVNYPSISVACSKKDKYGWLDRTFSFGQFFLEEMNTLNNDKNKDGKVSPYEAFLPAKERAVQYRKDINDFLRTAYEGNGIKESELKKMDLVPVYIERLD